MRITRLILIAGLLALFVATAASAAGNVYPTVTFQFDENTFEYIYTVTMTPQDTFAFGYLQIDTTVANAGDTAWTMRGPDGWDMKTIRWDDENQYDSAIWTTPNHVNPSNWVGVFTLVVPNSFPGEGSGLTMNGGINSENVFTIDVPGPSGIVPEPSSLAALAGGLFGLGGMYIRRRKA